MSSAVHGNWLAHFRHLQATATPALDRLRARLKDSIMPATTNGAAEAFAPEQTALEARAEAPPSRYVEITKDVLAGREPAITFARLSAHGVACEVGIVKVTPEIAARYLERRSANRNLRRKNLEFLMRQLRGSHWAFNGEPLIFNENNELIDGQHRCTSCVKSGVPFLTLVVRDIRQDAYDRIDLGAKRTNKDVLIIEGVPQADIAAPTVARLVEFEAVGNWWESRLDTPGHEILRRLGDFPGLEKHYGAARELARQLGGGRAMWAAARWLTFAKDEAVAREFWSRLETGERLEPGDPELRLRQRLLDVRLSVGKIELTPKAYAGLIAAAWNYRRKGRKIQQLIGLRGDEPVPAFL